MRQAIIKKFRMLHQEWLIQPGLPELKPRRRLSDMMFYLPSAWVDSKDETVLRVNYTPRSLGCPDLGMNSKSPFDDYGMFAVDLLNFSLDPEKSNNGKDTVEYLIAAKNAPIRIGSLKSNAMLKALNEDILNPRILDAMHLGLAEGGALRSGKIDLRFMTQAFKYSVELPGLPGMRVFEGFLFVVGPRMQKVKVYPSRSLKSILMLLCLM